MQNLLPSIQQVFSCWSSYKAGKPAMEAVLAFRKQIIEELETDNLAKAYHQVSQTEVKNAYSKYD